MMQYTVESPSAYPDSSRPDKTRHRAMTAKCLAQGLRRKTCGFRWRTPVLRQNKKTAGTIAEV